MSSMSLRSSVPGETPRINPYFQDIAPTVPVQAMSGVGGSAGMVAAALSGTFRPPSPLQRDITTGQVRFTTFSRPLSAASDDTDFSTTTLAQHRKELMNPMAVRLTPLGAVFVDESLEDSDHSSEEEQVQGGKLVTEVYLDEILDDPVPFEQAELEPCTPSQASDQSASSERSESPAPEQVLEPEAVSSEDELQPPEADQPPRAFAPGLSIQVNQDALSVGSDLAGYVARWEQAISKALDHDGVVAEVEHLAAHVAGALTFKVVFCNILAASEQEANQTFSRIGSAASNKSGGEGKGWEAIKRAGSGAAKRILAISRRNTLHPPTQTEPNVGDGRFSRRGSGAFSRMGSGGGEGDASGQGFVLKGSAAKRVRNDCMSRADHVWQQSIPHYVGMRATQVELMLPRGAAGRGGGRMHEGRLEQQEEGDVAAVASFKVGMLVQVSHAAPRLAVLAAGARGGAGTIVDIERGERDEEHRSGAERAWVVWVWWHDTGLLTKHSSAVTPTLDLVGLARRGSGGGRQAQDRGGGGGGGDQVVGGKGETCVMPTDFLRKVERGVGVYVKAEAGVMVQRRGSWLGWAAEEKDADGYIVSPELPPPSKDGAQDALHMKRQQAPHPQEQQQQQTGLGHRRACYVIWKEGGGAGMRNSDANADAEHRTGSVGHGVLTKLKELSAVKVPEARLSALLRRTSDQVVVRQTRPGGRQQAGEGEHSHPLPPPAAAATQSCLPAIGMRVQVCV
jgi:hypothetical protein